MKREFFYSVWNLPNEPLRRGYTAAYHVAKYDKVTLFEEEGAYTVKLFSRNNWYRCDCPGFANWGKCKHQLIVQLFVEKNKVGTGSLYDHDNQRWSNQFIDVPYEPEED